MPSTKSDISNHAVRIFLQEVGKRYDDLRSMPRYGGTPAHKLEIMRFFDDECCYCGVRLDLQNLNQDHLVPMNKQSLGLHAWATLFPRAGRVIARSTRRPGNRTY